MDKLTNMKAKLFKTMLCAGMAGTLLTGCMEESVYNPDAPKKQFEQNWKKQFGEIDPNQTWNTATRVTAKVNLGSLSGNYDLKIYTENPIHKNAKLLAQKQVNGNATISFDAPQTLTYTFVTIENEQGKVVNSYHPINENILDISDAAARSETRAEVSTTFGNPVTLEKSFWNGSANVTGKFTYYPLQNVSTTPSENVWKISDFKQIIGQDGPFAEGKSNSEIYKDKFTADVYYEMKETGPITLTLSYMCTGGKNKFGYFYYFDDAEIEMAKKYVLNPEIDLLSYIQSASYQEWTNQYADYTDISANGQMLGYVPDNTKVKGTEFKLVYFNETGNASYNFPKGIKVAFFNINNNLYDGINYSLGSLNEKLNGYNGRPATTAVTYNFSGTTILGFEDWGGNDGGGNDLNDIMFFATGNFEKPQEINPEYKPDSSAQPWILACEDLGNTEDFDFNDVVFKVEHVAGSKTATVTPLAAGGVLAAEIYYGETPIGEIHQMLGTSGLYITNTANERGNAGASKTIEVPDGFSMTNNMGNFKIKIAGKDGNKTEVTTVNAPNNGEAPQMICIDGSTNWAWPTERTSISVAYPKFGEWGANYSTNADWYNHPVLKSDSDHLNIVQ